MIWSALILGICMIIAALILGACITTLGKKP
jgi:hypothetical protein